MVTGTVRRRDDKWQYIINLPFDPVKGSYPQIRKSGFASKKEAQEALRIALVEMNEGTPSTSKLTVHEYLSTWTNSIKETVAMRTWETYMYSSQIIQKHIGNIELNKLTHTEIEHMYRILADQHLANSSVHRIHRVLRTALNRAVRRGIITSSPMVRVDPPSAKIERRNILSADQAQTLLDWLEIHRPYTYVAAIITLHTGMRRGEICGLQWRDVDWERKIIRVVRSRQRRNGQDYVSNPKTITSIRPIPVDQELIETLTEWRKKFIDTPNESNFILSRFDGVPIDPATLARDIRIGIAKTYLPDISFHDLRHTHATLLLQEGVAMKIVSERLGHSNINVTANTYSHVTETMQEAATEKIAAILTRKKIGTNSEHDKK